MYERFLRDVVYCVEETMTLSKCDRNYDLACEELLLNSRIKILFKSGSFMKNEYYYLLNVINKCT